MSVISFRMIQGTEYWGISNKGISLKWPYYFFTFEIFHNKTFFKIVYIDIRLANLCQLANFSQIRLRQSNYHPLSPSVRK